MTKWNLAIDGPAGAGKSTVAKRVADQLSMVYIDTGAMYRALTWLALNKDVNIHDEAEMHHLLKESDIRLRGPEGEEGIYVNGTNVSKAIREPQVTNNVSYTAQHAAIRKEMLRKQQLLAAEGGTVMDGRDIGTAVLPNAEVKIFLTASTDERAKRRYEEEIAKGMDSDFEKLKKEIAERDKIDSERTEAPLKKASDAVELDTTELTVDEAVNKICLIAEKRVDADE
ncbi:(d)CMP kinase [Salisediminibacterium halotolerans]|uniref:Cytidylate kinase n=1 Tax=Salisediminibacterium halotolerans TaxID=517425 RepID=A0A1H9P5S6_9BACI|nr:MULTISPECIES: (d)CMP kinase [Salisediminibacterium]RLJ77961.1 cytidylate kinase [Actinophytocola xinjiangensis]RPE88701.1 cytidylate kinase [Salisediminibacterium halotolerans]TWG36938.1 cytidylate kinase [Salisediminibacterium halotolerans]SER43179.1 cytidylate kinase [Salisediminibacterium haloalkalitolerans]GEL08101.1 cytidylate kinase [Salisediminibacterium halotolerans]